MTTETEDLLWRRFNEWFRARRPDYPSEWDAYQAGYAAAKAETAAAVAQPDYCPIGGEPCQSMCAVPCGTSRIEPLSDGRILGMWPDSGMPNKLIEFARCVEAAHGIGVKGRMSEWRCMKESKK